MSNQRFKTIKSMRFNWLLLMTVILMAFFTSATPSFAEDTPPVPAPVGQVAITPPAAPDPAPVPAPAAAEVPTPARKEEDPPQIRSGFFAGLFGKGGITPAQAADELSRLRAENDSLRTQLATAQSALAAAQTELSAIANDWPAIREALVTGNAAAPVLQTPLGQQVNQSVAAAAANATSASTHAPQNLPGPGAATPPAAADKKKPTLAEAAAAHWKRVGGVYQPGQN